VVFSHIINEKARDIQNQLQLVNSNVSELLQDTKALASDERTYHREHALRIASKEREATLAWLTSVSFISEHKAFQEAWIPDTTQWFFKDLAFHQ
jgi:hypothetical protein